MVSGSHSAGLFFVYFFAFFKAAPEQGMGQCRHQGDGHNQRCNQREDHGQGKRQEQLAHHSADKSKRQEYGDRNNRRRHDRHEHFARSRADQLSAAQPFAGKRHTAVNILDNDNRVIDYPAYSHGHRAKRHHIKGNVHLTQTQHGNEQRQRNGDNGNDGGADIPQEQQDDKDCEKGTKNSFGQHCMDRILNRLTLIKQYSQVK
ncbi:hypothetical protein D3C86_1610980 [compost metagenome]